MNSQSEHIHPEFYRFLSREEKEKSKQQQGIVLWMYGLSGSGKSTIANAAERMLFEKGKDVAILDGDNLRVGLNRDLGFSEEDRNENVRRNAEVAKLFAQQGIITFVSVITPRRALRDLARSVIGADFHEIYIKADYETCAQRDPKGLYQKAARGEVKQFTGKESVFEEPEQCELVLDSSQLSVEESSAQLLRYLNSHVTFF